MLQQWCKLMPKYCCKRGIDAQAEIQSRQTKCQYELPVQLNNYGYTFILVFSFSSACVFFCPKNHFKTLEQPVFVTLIFWYSSAI